MPTNDPICCECGQHRQAEDDLRECMNALTMLTVQFADTHSSLGHGSFMVTKNVSYASARALLARLGERYPNE